MLLEGLHIPLTTPFHPDGRLNLPKLAANVARYSKSPAAGLLALGPSGEPTLLSDDETRDALAATAQAAAPEKVLIAGVSRDSLRATLAIADCAASLLYDVVLIGAPTVLAQESRELILYFQTVADRSPLPLLLFSGRARRIPLDAVAELAAHPNILGLLNAAATPAEIEAILRRTASVKREVEVTPVFCAVTERMKRSATSPLLSAASLTVTAVAEPTPVLRTRTRSVGFQLLAGCTHAILNSLHAGAVGAAPAFAAAAPQACYEVLAAWKDQDSALAEEKQSRLAAAASLAEAAPGNLKFACDLNGYFGGPPRLPHLPPSAEQRDAIQRLMQPLRN